MLRKSGASFFDTELEGFASAGRRIACLRPCCKKEKAGFRKNRPF
jgi:hypothetical protein